MQNNANNTPAPSKNEQKSKTIKVSVSDLQALKDKVGDILSMCPMKDYTNYSTICMELLGRYAGKDDDVAERLKNITDYHFTIWATIGEFEELQHLVHELDGSNTSEGLLEKRLINIDALINHRDKLLNKYTSMLRTYNVSYELNKHSVECEFFKKELAKMQAEIEKLDVDIEYFKIK